MGEGQERSRLPHPGPYDPAHPLSLPNLPHPTRTGVLELLHIPIILEVLKQAASRRKRGTGGNDPATVGVSKT